MDKSEATISEATGVADWLKTRNLWEETDSREKQLFCAKPGNWPVMELLNASWMAEGCHVLAWALQIREDLLPWDTQAESYELFERLLSSKTSALPKFELRLEEEIRAKLELAELWLWRARTTLLQKNPEEYELDPSLDLNEVVKMAATKAAEEGWLDPIGEDFPAFGKSFRELNDDEYSTITSIAVERLRAFNWLCGYAENWKDVPTDT